MLTLYHVTDCPFNRYCDPKLIGLYFLHSPDRVVVEILTIELI